MYMYVYIYIYIYIYVYICICIHICMRLRRRREEGGPVSESSRESTTSRSMRAESAAVKSFSGFTLRRGTSLIKTTLTPLEPHSDSRHRPAVGS